MCSDFLFLSQVVHTSLKDMVPKQIRSGDPELAKPDDELIEKTTEKTRNALEFLVQKKVAAAQPVRAAEKLAPAQYIRWSLLIIRMGKCLVYVEFN